MLLLLLCFADLFADFPQLCVESKKILKSEKCVQSNVTIGIIEMSVCMDSYHVDT